MSMNRKPKSIQSYLEVTLDVLLYIQFVFEKRKEKKVKLTLTIIFSPTCIVTDYTMYVILRGENAR